jgi:poly(3-hydroxybutyrate) depolymerase
MAPVRAQDFDPKAKGELQRSYVFTEAGGVVSRYRLYVPSSWSPGEHLPLVVILHGGGGDVSPASVFDGAPETLKGILQRQAEAHGFVLAAPQGYKGGYGVPYLFPPGQGSPGGPNGPGIPAGGQGRRLGTG